jgi:hypothetical protein
MAALKAAVREQLGFGPGWVGPDAWDERDALNGPSQKQALTLLGRLRDDVEALTRDVRIASAFLARVGVNEPGCAVAFLRKWLEVYSLRTLSAHEQRGEVARFVPPAEGLPANRVHPRADHNNCPHRT